MKKILVALLGAVVFGSGIGSLAHALTVTSSGSVGIQVGTGTAVQATTTLEGGGSADGMGVLANIDVNAGLQGQAQAVGANTSSEDAIVQLQGSSVNMIQTQADLDAYNNFVIQDRPAVKAINVNSDNTVAIGYSQPAKLFGIFPTSISGQVDVDTQGNTTLHLPWWGFLYSKNTAAVQTSVAAAVQQSVSLNPSMQANAAAGATVNATDETSIQNTARIISAATAALQAQAQANASANVAAQ